MECIWCGKPTGDEFEANDIHVSCLVEMQKENVNITTNKFDSPYTLHVPKERMKILLNLKDIAKVEYFKIKNRDSTRLTQIQLQNKELTVLNQLPEEED